MLLASAALPAAASEDGADAPAFPWEVATGLGGAGGGALLAWLLANKKKLPVDVSPQPFDVRLSEDCVKKDECKKDMDDLKNRVEKLENNWLTDVRNIYKKLDACADGIAEIRGFLFKGRGK